jgi:lipopolysaccharide transport system permease protein
MLAVYTFFFTEVFPTRWNAAGATRGEFALVVFIGLLLHGLFAEAATRAPMLIVSNPNLVKKVVFPLDLLPVVNLGSALFHFAIGLAIWFVFHLFLKGLPPLTALCLPLVLLPLVVLILGLSWMLASLGVYLRDVNHVVPVLVTILLFASPVFYPLEALTGWFRMLVLASPLTVPIEESRRVLLAGAGPQFGVLGLYALVALAIAYAGFVWFQGTRKGFADVL